MRSVVVVLLEETQVNIVVVLIVVEAVRQTETLIQDLPISVTITSGLPKAFLMAADNTVKSRVFCTVSRIRK